LSGPNAQSKPGHSECANRWPLWHNPLVIPTRPRHLTAAAGLLFLIGCNAKDDEDTADPDTEQRCTSAIEYRFPDGTVATYDGCNDVLVDVTYEFDPDDPPEIRSFKVQFAREDVVGDDCWMVITARGICGEGRYEIDTTASTTVEFATHDCSDVADEYEDSYVAVNGLLNLQTVSGGDTPGNFTGQRLRTELKGTLEANTGGGGEVTVQFDLAVYISGEDAEESTCLRVE
jgi:hypothetical protein